MAKVFGLKVNFLSIMGCIVLCSLLVLSVTWILGKFFDENELKNIPITTKQIQSINEPRYRHNDSLFMAKIKQYKDSLATLNNLISVQDSLIENFYTIKKIENEKIIDAVNYEHDSDILRFWAERYNKK